MNLDQFESIREYVGFGNAELEVLREFKPHVAQAKVDIVDDFYRAIQQHPDAHAAISGGPEQVERLKKTLGIWIDSVLSDERDAAYLDAHDRIGRVHVRIELPQEYMFTAMNRIRTALLQVARDTCADDANRFGVVCNAINQALDLELAVMLDSYREDLVDRMRARERLATVGQLAATIAHELRNPLGTIESSLFLLKQRFKKLQIDDATIERHHDKIARQVDQSGRTISTLLELAKNRPARTELVDAGEFIQEAIAAAELSEGVKTDVEVDIGATLRIDPDQLRRVVVNLLHNAAEAMNQRGTIHISATRKEGAMEVHIHDDGPGVPRELRRRVFDVLYTTKASGVGLGLALCHRIIEAHGGEISLVDSETGAHFRIWLPQ